MKRGYSVKIHLVDGDPNGLWHVRKSNSIGLAIRCPRAAWNAARGRDELQATGVYVLSGEDEDGPLLYVGEADVLAKRIGQHDSGKEFWDTATCFTATDDSLNKAHARYLESRLLTLLRSAGHRLANGTGSAGSRLTAVEVDEVEGFLDEVTVLLPILGITMGAAGPAKTNGQTNDADGQRLLRSNIYEADATATYGPAGLIVRQGSTCAKDRPAFIGKGYHKLRRQLIANGIITDDDGTLTFTQDHAFKSPSAAAAVVGGKNLNGWISWIDGQGRTLDELERQATNPASTQP